MAQAVLPYFEGVLLVSVPHQFGDELLPLGEGPLPNRTCREPPACPAQVPGAGSRHRAHRARAVTFFSKSAKPASAAADSFLSSSLEALTG